jgi:hypothetical protein
MAALFPDNVIALSFDTFALGGVPEIAGVRNEILERLLDEVKMFEIHRKIYLLVK